MSIRQQCQVVSLWFFFSIFAILLPPSQTKPHSGRTAQQPRVCGGHEESADERTGKAQRHRLRQADALDSKMCQGHQTGAAGSVSTVGDGVIFVCNRPLVGNY